MSSRALSKRSKQLSFESAEFFKPNAEFGGSLLKSHPKCKRPLSTTLPLHLCLRANFSTLRLPKNYAKVHKEIYRCAKKYGIKLYKYANVGNHLHLLIRLTNLRVWAKFIRELTSSIARLVNKRISERIKSGVASESPPLQFWKHRPFTRIVRGWGKAFKIMQDYIDLNQIEAEGHISRKNIKTLRDLRSLFESG